MCKLRDDTMSQAGELPKEKNMQHDKESGAAVRALPSDLNEAERLDLLCQVETYMTVTDKHSQTHPEAEAEEVRIYGLVNSLIAKRFSDIGAAVRGEPVADERWCLACDKAGHRTDECWSTHGMNTPQDRELMRLCHAVVSARAADAPSEPSELDGWNKAANALSERAAGHFRNKDYELQDECLQCASMLHDLKPSRTAAVKSRTADALDSQPTEKRCADCNGICSQSCYCLIQPTVAAQQGSIGDDAQFLDLLGAYALSFGSGTVPRASRAHAALIAYIDSRASSAPVAPIAPDGWISITERLPDLHVTVALLDESRWMNTGSDSHNVNWHGAGYLCEFGQKYWSVFGESRSLCLDAVTHWAAIPPAPQQEGSEAGNG